MSVSRNLREGSIPSHFRALAIPTAIGMVFTTLYNVVDTYFAGMLSTDAQAGLALSFQVFFILMAIGIGLSSAMSSLVGNALGEDDEADAKKIASQGLVLGVTVSALVVIIGQIVSPMLIALITEAGPHRDAANSYLTVLIFAAPAFILAFTGNGILTAQGNTVTMQRAQMAAFVGNIILNPVLIFGIPGIWDGLGFNGIAVSTLINQTGVMSFILWRVMQSDVMAHHAEISFRPDLAHFKMITVQALPVSFAMTIMIMAGFIIQFFLKDFGAEAQAAYGIGLRVEQLILLPGFGLTGALLPIAAQNFGAKNFARVREALFFCFKAGVIMMLIGSALLWLGGRFMMSIFTNDPEVIRLGGDYLNVDGFMLPVYIVLFATNSFLQALKKPMWTVWIGLYRQAFGVLFFVWLLVRVLDMGTWGVWIGIALAVGTGCLVSLWVTKHIADKTIGGLWSNPREVRQD